LTYSESQIPTKMTYTINKLFRDHIWEDLVQLLHNRQEERLIIGGDFNEHKEKDSILED
jgi:hypothetical protein